MSQRWPELLWEPRLRTHVVLAFQVEGVLCSKAGSTSSGTVHLTAHHLIFAYDDKDKEELWVSAMLYPAAAG